MITGDKSIVTKNIPPPCTGRIPVHAPAISIKPISIYLAEVDYGPNRNNLLNVVFNQNITGKDAMGFSRLVLYLAVFFYYTFFYFILTIMLYMTDNLYRYGDTRTKWLIVRPHIFYIREWMSTTGATYCI